ncbi:uncharacterized protein [Euphorbia lathyris]|uniref:uncharacterized protein n=1 Tax=Euphorbia lathyris TaxID=212925 RepID=UPI003313D220
MHNLCPSMQGLIGAVEMLFPNAEHRLCVRHMYTNFRTKFKGKELKDLIWNAARAPYMAKHVEWLNKIEQVSPKAREWLRQRPSEHWARACFSDRAQCDMLLNNLCECFNKYILDARDKGIITMYEMIKVKLMKRIKNKADIMRKNNKKFCGKILKKLEINKDWARHYVPTYSGGPRVQINGLGEQFVVNLEDNTCTCRRWQLNGIPCSHGCAAIIGQNDNPENYLAECYSVETYLRVYSFIIEPTNGMDQWPNEVPPVPIVPLSPVKSKRGRRQRARRKYPEEIEASSRGKLSRKGNMYMTCRKCGGKNHNKRTCTSQATQSTAPQSKRARTTPRQATSPPGTTTSERPATSQPPPSTTIRWMMDGTSQTIASTSQPTQPSRESRQPNARTHVRPERGRRTRSSYANPQRPWH